jgi:hypothetical protein
MVFLKRRIEMKTRNLSVILSVLFLTVLFALFRTNAAYAQECGGDGEDEPCPEPVYDNGPDTIGGEATNTGVTKSIVKILQGANGTCDRRIELRYRIDCLRIYYLRVAESLPDSGDYLPVKQAMLDAAAKLDAIVLANLDETAPLLRPRDGHKPAAKRLPPVRAVKESFAETAAIEAARVVEETELIIIRSGGDPARRTQHYTDIATAVEDNLIILRSA